MHLRTSSSPSEGSKYSTETSGRDTVPAPCHPAANLAQSSLNRERLKALPTLDKGLAPLQVLPDLSTPRSGTHAALGEGDRGRRKLGVLTPALTFAAAAPAVATRPYESQHAQGPPDIINLHLCGIFSPPQLIPRVSLGHGVSINAGTCRRAIQITKGPGKQGTGDNPSDIKSMLSSCLADRFRGALGSDPSVSMLIFTGSSSHIRTLRRFALGPPLSSLGTHGATQCQIWDIDGAHLVQGQAFLTRQGRSWHTSRLSTLATTLQAYRDSVLLSLHTIGHKALMF